MASTLVYFSRSGHTRKVAEAIATRCGADLEQIRDLRDRRGFLGYLRSAREALKGRPADILPPLRNVEDYDLVVLGTPVWAGHVSSPMRAYIAAHEPARARVAFFCTLGGSRAKRVLDETRALCGKEPVATLAVTDVQIDREGYDRELERFVRAMALRKTA